MRLPRREATRDDSKGLEPVLRAAAVAVAGAGALLTAIATSRPVVEVTVLTTSEVEAGVDTSLSGGDRHGPALVLLALLAAVMLAGVVLRRAVPAAAAVALTGITVLALAFLRDVPALDDTQGLEELYEDVSAGAGSGFYLETLGGVLLLLGGGVLVALLRAPGAAAPAGAPKAPKPPKAVKPPKAARPPKPPKAPPEPAPAPEPAAGVPEPQPGPRRRRSVDEVTWFDDRP
jgi:hypothetical protein